MAVMNPHSMAGDNENVQSEEMIAAGSGEVEPTGNRNSFQERVQEFERQIITEALEETGGRVTRAAKNLGLSHQGLCYIINHRHKDLLSVRTPIRIRRKSIITRGKVARRSR